MWSYQQGHWRVDKRWKRALQIRSQAPSCMSWRWTWAPSAPSAISRGPSARRISTWTSSCMYGHLWKTPDIQSLAPRFCCWTHPHCNLNSETCFSEETMQGLWPALTSYPRMGLSCSLQRIMLVSTICQQIPVTCTTSEDLLWWYDLNCCYCWYFVQKNVNFFRSKLMID